MRFLRYLQEEYVARAGQREIFKNPDKKEIMAAAEDGYLRFIADFTKKNLFVFSGDLLHSTAMGFLRKEKEVKYSYSEIEGGKASKMADNYALGTADVSADGKLEFYRSDTGAAWQKHWTKKPLKWMKMDDSWLNSWFAKPFIQSYIELSTPGKVNYFK